MVVGTIGPSHDRRPKSRAIHESTGWESNSRCRITGAESWPLNDPCLFVEIQPVGSEGLEPSPSWLRARHAAANTLIPNRMGPDGLEPTPGRLKVCCAAVTPRPRQGPWLCLCRVALHDGRLCIHVQGRKNRWEWSRTTVSAISERRASVTPPSVIRVRRISFSRDGRNRTDFLVFPRHAGARCPSSR